MIHGVRSDREADRQAFAARQRSLVDCAEITRRGEIDTRRRLAPQHQAANTHIGHAALRVMHEVDRGRYIGAAVQRVLNVDWKFGQVDLVAGQHDFLHGRLIAAHRDDLRRAPQPSQHFAQKLGRGDAESLG